MGGTHIPSGSKRVFIILKPIIPAMQALAIAPISDKTLNTVTPINLIKNKKF
jgi:hypothetical protein